eukprot:NODE_627_length_700_cov_141.898778_g618_i0.p2 GENE.NODE_627_length_700_cov_141.898778_g618_i0~~NODE_627_length_700_cov_141.898778_g618_i0.p2  ORF type:complete len:171 (+),score=45.72 NODE_627_length_700_cov_141.898778_g618_i0:60-515(+)
MAEIEKEKEKARMAELLEIRKRITLQTERRAELALEKLQMQAERQVQSSLVSDNTLTLEMKARELDDKEKALEYEWQREKQRQRRKTWKRWAGWTRWTRWKRWKRWKRGQQWRWWKGEWDEKEEDCEKEVQNTVITDRCKRGLQATDFLRN